MIWDRKKKGSAVTRHQELINFASSQQAQIVLEENLTRGALVDTSEEGVNQVANFEVFEVSPSGARERLLARLSVFDDARAMASVSKKGKSRVVVHFGEVVWPAPA